MCCVQIGASGPAREGGGLRRRRPAAQPNRGRRGGGSGQALRPPLAAAGRDVQGPRGGHTFGRILKHGPAGVHIPGWDGPVVGLQGRMRQCCRELLRMHQRHARARRHREPPPHPHPHPHLQPTPTPTQLPRASCCVDCVDPSLNHAQAVPMHSHRPCPTYPPPPPGRRPMCGLLKFVGHSGLFW